MHSPEELSRLEREWDKAIENNNVEKIGHYMSDDWVIVGSDGITTRSDFLSAVESGDLVHTQMDFETIQVRINGSTGTVISRGTSSGKYKGEPFSFYEWSTSVYVFTDNGWKCVLTSITGADGRREKGVA